MELDDNQETELPEKQILAVIMDFARVYEHADPEKKKMFLNTLVKDITLTPQRKLDKINLNIELQRKTPKTEKRPHTRWYSWRGLPPHFTLTYGTVHPAES